MGEAFGLFWRKAWDYLGHVVIVNMIWLTLAIPFLLSVYALHQALTVPVSAAEMMQPAAATAEPSESGEPERAVPSIGSTDAGPALDSSAAALAKPRTRFEWSWSAIPAMIFVLSAWVLLCIGTGFVVYVTADMVVDYDFAGYAAVTKTFLRRGPVLRSVGTITLFAVVFFASWANLMFYARLAQTYGVLLLILAGVMLWFILFTTMAFMYALPIIAQKDKTIFQALKIGGIFALSTPVRSFFVLLVGFLIFTLGMVSGAGAGFFAVSAPSMLFNADVKARFDAAEGKDRPAAEAGEGEEL